LFPALAVVIVFAVIVAFSFVPLTTRHPTIAGLPWVIFYVGNWDAAFHPSSLGLLAHTWSLAIEEQFYLLWPAIFLLCFGRRGRRRGVGLGFLVAAAAEMAYRFAMIPIGWSSARLYDGLDTHSDGLLVGCGIAFLLAARGQTRSGRRAKVGGVLGAMLVGVTIFLATPVRLNLLAAGISAAVIGTGAVLWAVLTASVPALSRVLESRPAVWVGRRSYGLYLWHYPIIEWLRPERSTGLLGYAADVGLVALSFLMAALSYRYVEQPFLRRKVRFQRASPKEALATLL
jgi:peptidoglycan/LPS O-acetylase OafA/YrhL